MREYAISEQASIGLSGYCWHDTRRPLETLKSKIRCLKMDW